MSLTSSVSRRYATAIVEAAADAGTLEATAREIESFCSVYESVADLRNVLVNPTFTNAEKSATLSAIMTKLQLSDMTRRFLELLASRERMSELPGIAPAVRRLTDERASLIRASIQSASPLPPEVQQRLQKALEAHTGKKVQVEVTVDPALLGGVRATIGSTVLDGTLRTQLDNLRETLQAG